MSHQTWGQFSSRIGIVVLSGMGIYKFGIEVCYNKLNSQINLLFNFLIQKYFFHDNPTWNIVDFAPLPLEVARPI